MATVHSDKTKLFTDGSVIAWQTGRWYSEAGQRIAAARTDDDRIVFLDYDRGIDGEIVPDPAYMPYIKDNPTELRDYIMTEYDYGRYAHTNDRELVKCLGLVCKFRIAEAS